MHPSYQTTVSGISAALTGIARSVQMPAETLTTFGDVCRHIERGAHTRISLEILAGIKPEMSIEDAMRRLDTVIDRQVDFGKAKHWAYSQCKHLALLEHRQKLSDFLFERERHLEAAE